jgi:hypothetical protein
VDIPSWKYLHYVIIVIDSLVPFLINLICTAGIICIVTKKKMNTNAGAARKYRSTQVTEERFSSSFLAISMIKMKTVTDEQTSTCPEVAIVSGQ